MVAYKSEDQVICDCKPGLLYSLKHDSCHLAYKRGPCEEGEYLVPPESHDSEATCQPNPCKQDGLVMFDDECKQIYLPHVCKAGHQISVDHKTFELECKQYYNSDGTKLAIPRRRVLVERIPVKSQPTYPKGGISAACPQKGSKRNALKICKRII